ncbi:polar amino acid ABC transporter permease [Helicobacter sp. 12S02232-10]|uniref:amino acid ABC transporter permease n=1 Tax=Helicobacter sp. 12S02232-10 TaxID=1476197 RepID=UPI000BA58FF3|nr:amino acid ABC transporter permease [Helicobacter sp. 12S02232-10]PAF48752.1 polar amino acid ABC transporter permease [Helicobacter sp. 12S02232-10]
MLDWQFMIDSIPAYVKGLYLTLGISFFGIAFSILIGFFISLILFYQVRFLKNLANFYIEVSRNTPLLIQLFFLYYGLSEIGIVLSAYHCAIVGLAFLGGSYMAESFRSGLNAVSNVQIEAGLSLGLNRFQMIYYVIFPQSLAVSMPSIGANAIFLLKETSVVSAIALADVMFVTKDLIGTYYKTTEALLMLIGAYLIVLLPISALFVALEHYYKKRS